MRTICIYCGEPLGLSIYYQYGGDSGMKRFYTLFLFGLVVFMLVSAQGAVWSDPAFGAANENKSQRLSVFARFYPIYDFAVKIGGERGRDFSFPADK